IRMATEPSENANPLPARIKPLQWNLPVSFDQQGNPVSLRRYSTRDATVIPYESLTPAQRTTLAVKRIEMQPDFEIAVFGVGVYDAQSAVHEIQSGTRLGRKLVAIDERVVLHLLTETQKGRR